MRKHRYNGSLPLLPHILTSSVTFKTWLLARQFFSIFDEKFSNEFCSTWRKCSGTRRSRTSRTRWASTRWVVSWCHEVKKVMVILIRCHDNFWWRCDFLMVSQHVIFIMSCWYNDIKMILYKGMVMETWCHDGVTSCHHVIMVSRARWLTRWRGWCLLIMSHRVTIFSYF